jgi:hypothetical protein
MDMETPEEDAVEQYREVVTDEESQERLREAPREVPYEVDEADAAEQTRDVGFDDDDYR